MVVCQHPYPFVQKETQHGWNNSHKGRPAVLHRSFGQQSEGKQTQQRAVSIADNGVDSINQTGGVDGFKHQDKQYKYHAHQHMNPLAEAFIPTLLQQIDATDGCQRRQGRVGTGERRSHNTENEQDFR